ncbi:MAG: hypothetical protein V1818_02585 [Candidatus Aenigmatarchaeota archaeon]
MEEVNKERIFLKCLVKGSENHYTVRLLKAHGKLKMYELGAKVKNLETVLTGLGASIITDDSNISLSPNYDFVITHMDYSFFLHRGCDKHNRKKEPVSEIILPKLPTKSKYLIRSKKSDKSA